MQEFKKTRVIQELQEKKESDKNSRTQESWSRPPRLGLHEPCQKVKICFFRQESCIERVTKES